MSGSKARPATGLSFVGVTGLSAPPPPEDEPQSQGPLKDDAPGDESAPPAVDVGTRPRRTADPFKVPDLPTGRPRRRKIDMYVRADLADQVEKITRYAAYHLGMKKKGEVQDVLLAMALENPAELLRTLREHVRARGQS